MSHLQQKLGFSDVFWMTVGGASGIFILPGLAYSLAGPAAMWAYALAGLLLVPGVLSLVELATAMPRSGANYIFIERSIGGPVGTFAGLANWFASALTAAFALLGIGATARVLWPGLSVEAIKWIALGGCVLFTGLNCLSVYSAGRVQILLVLFLVGVISLFVVMGLPRAWDHLENLHGTQGEGGWSILPTTGFVFISFLGLSQVTNVAGEVRRPGRNIPRAMLAALGLVTVLYVLAVFVAIGVEGPKLRGSLIPLAQAAREFLGPLGLVLMGTGAFLDFLTTANGSIMAASRHPLAMSQDGLLPAPLGRLSARFGAPYVSVLATGAFIAVVIAALSIEDLIKVASTMMLVLFALTNLAVLIMRGSHLQNYRPLFRAPWHPLGPLVGIAAYSLLIAGMGRVPLLTSAAFALAGTVWHFAYVRSRRNRESALMYMVRNVVSREMYRSTLEEELKQIALERDQVVHDRFDHLIRQCPILDLHGPIDHAAMFLQVAEALAGRLNLDPQDLHQRFLAREAQSSTVVQPGLAIPHVIVPGQNVFEIALVRCKEGVAFPGQAEPVKTAFVLAGSVDQRNYHLRALMAVAHIVQEHGFAARWLAAGGGEHLRDIILLSGRQRDSAASER